MSEWSRARPAVAKTPSRRGVISKLWSAPLVVLLILLCLPVVAVALYRVVPPSVTPLMLIRAAVGAPIRQRWVPLAQISPSLVRAVVGSEDARFCLHHGFDYEEINAALERYRASGKLRGASTISQQTAKNILLWPGGGFLRKGIEAYITELLELGWPKSRILEVYLNVIEWGDGVYGAEQAALHAFPQTRLGAHAARGGAAGGDPAEPARPLGRAPLALHRGARRHHRNSHDPGRGARHAGVPVALRPLGSS